MLWRPLLMWTLCRRRSAWHSKKNLLRLRFKSSCTPRGPGQSHPHARKSPGAISPAAGKCCARRNSPHSIAQTYTPTCCAEEVWSNMARPRPAWQLKVGPRRPCRRPSADAPSLGCHRPSAAPMRSDLDVPKVL